MSQQYDLIVVGGGIAGYHTALSARETNPDLRVLILSADRETTCSAPCLPDYIAGHIPRKNVFVAREETFREKGIHLSLGERVVSADPEKHTVTTDRERTLRYGALVLATGSEPIRLRRMEGTALPGNHVLKRVTDADALAKAPARRAVVVGTGAIGLEGASSLKERGVEEVTLVEALEWINPKCFDRAASDYMKKAFADIGVHVLTGEAITAVEGVDRVTGVRTEKRSIPCDLVLWGIGMRPVTDLAASMGVCLSKSGGIEVDAFMRTNLPDVYAVGDCTEPYDEFYQRPMANMLWRTATEQGTFVGTYLAGGDVPEEGYEGGKLLFLTYVGDAPACSYGYTEGALKGKRYTVLEDRQEDSYRKVLLQNHKIVGFQMVNTLEGANELYAQIRKGATVDLKGTDREEFIRFPEKYFAMSAYLRQMKM